MARAAVGGLVAAVIMLGLIASAQQMVKSNQKRSDYLQQVLAQMDKEKQPSADVATAATAPAPAPSTSAPVSTKDDATGLPAYVKDPLCAKDPSKCPKCNIREMLTSGRTTTKEQRVAGCNRPNQTDPVLR